MSWREGSRSCRVRDTDHACLGDTTPLLPDRLSRRCSDILAPLLLPGEVINNKDKGSGDDAIPQYLGLKQAIKPVVKSFKQHEQWDREPLLSDSHYRIPAGIATQRCPTAEVMPLLTIGIGKHVDQLKVVSPDYTA
ncbi:hypothetical protein J6590_085845 [Homalodisca vitripennis]|nr:hypothetical protein J6590_085845 [Homalodisca vitripennis]